MHRRETTRRNLVKGLASLVATGVLGGCDRLSRTSWFPAVLGAVDPLNHAVHDALTSESSMAQEFSEADLSPEFRSNGTSFPDDAAYRRMAADGFADWRLEVRGLVSRPASFSLAELRAMAGRTQITRHDCVEGWSAIGKWTGVPLRDVLARVGPEPRARFAVFHCADPMNGHGDRYYESVDMENARHPQTLLAYELNDAPLPVANGAPVRLRVERQLGYKMAKYVMAIELVEDFSHIGRGKGGYWEDRGYAWYAGI